MKSWRDSGSPRYREITGFDPVEFAELYERRPSTRNVAWRGGCLVLPAMGLITLALAAMALLG